MSEVYIKPLLEYTVTFDDDQTVTFTADGHDYDDSSGMFVFYRTGNKIREINRIGVSQIVSRPASA